MSTNGQNMMCSIARLYVQKCGKEYFLEENDGVFGLNLQKKSD